MLVRYKTDAQADAAFEELHTYWRNLLTRFSLTSGNDKVNRMVNIWNQYQCMITFNMSRSASYYESGVGRGMGFRDSCQDLLGFVHLIPERARERIIDIASTQFQDGSAYHQYQPLTKRAMQALVPASMTTRSGSLQLCPLIHVRPETILSSMNLSPMIQMLPLQHRSWSTCAGL